MRRLMIAALSALMLMCAPFSDPKGCGLHSTSWTPLMINLLRVSASDSSIFQERERMQALDFEASRTTALRPELGEYRIVHFATHEMLNNIHPELSGMVLSLIDKKGHWQDGFLRLQDIYNLKLSV